MKKLGSIFLLTFLFTFLWITNVSSVNLESKYLLWNSQLTYTQDAFQMFLNSADIKSKKLTYNIGKFNETYELYKTLTEILEKHNIYSNEFLFLLLGIAAVETYNGKYLNNKVARGIFQIEPDTAIFILNKANRNEDWNELVSSVFWNNSTLVKQLRENLELQVVILYMVLQFRKVEFENLPIDKHILAEIWKKYWNTVKGKGTVRQFKKYWVEVGIEDLKKEIIYESKDIKKSK